MMIRTTLLFIGLLYVSFACSQRSDRNDQDNEALVDSIRNKLVFPLDADERKLKPLKIVLSNDSVALNGVKFKNANALLSTLETVFENVYSKDQPDSTIAIQIYFAHNLSSKVHGSVYNGIERIYGGVWERHAQRIYSKPYSALSESEISVVKQTIPFYVNEYESLYKQ